MNALVKIPATPVDPRAAWLARAAALELLFLVGEVDLDTAFDRLAEQFAAILRARRRARSLNGGAS
jgi:hypothetical protein